MNAGALANYYEVNHGELIQLNTAWKPAAQTDQIALPAGTLVWLPAGTVERLAQRGIADRGLALADPVATSRLR